MNKDKNIAEMLRLIKQITNKIPARHLQHIFWSPKTSSDAGKVDGFILYAYGGYILKIFIKEERLVYKTNYHNYKNNYFGDLWDEKFEKNNCGVCKSSVNIDTLMGITSLWENILEAYRRRMYGEGAIDNKYFERGRATSIARNLEMNSNLEDFYFIEQESRIKASKKKPDLIGIRKNKESMILSFIEYKCTTGGMDGVTLTEHFEDMCNFYQNVDINAGYKTLYEQMQEFAEFKYCQLEKGFKVDYIGGGEIVFLFSHIGVENGITAQKIYNDVCRLIYNCKEYSKYKENVKFLVLKDENELYKTENYVDAETLLKHKIFENCDKDEWKNERRKANIM